MSVLLGRVTSTEIGAVGGSNPSVPRKGHIAQSGRALNFPVLKFARHYGHEV
jgi:hypothetical protein